MKSIKGRDEGTVGGILKVQVLWDWGNGTMTILGPKHPMEQILL